jgi:hypothetical protein
MRRVAIPALVALLASARAWHRSERASEEAPAGAGTATASPAAGAPARTTPLEAARAGHAATTTDEARATSEVPRTPEGTASAEKQAIVLPTGTVLPVRLETALSSAVSRAGDPVVGRLAEDVALRGSVALPAGTEVRGKVTTAVASGRVKGRARLAFEFDTVLVDGTPREIEARATDITAPSGKKKDAAIIGGGVGGGALIGALFGGKKGAGIGALAGGAAGTGVVLTTKGKEVEVPAGSRVRVKLNRELRVG